MSFDPDYGRMQTRHEAHIKGKKERTNDRAHEVMLEVGGRLTLNENDEHVEIIETLLGIKPGGAAKVAELLGVQPIDDNAQRALPAQGQTGRGRMTYDDYFKGLNQEGGVDAAFPTMEETIAGGYVVEVKNPDGSIKGYTKPPTPAGSTPTPLPTPDDTVKYTVQDRKSNDTDEKVTEAQAKRKGYIPITSNGAVHHYVNPGKIFGRKKLTQL